MAPPPCDDAEVAALLEAIAAATGSEWVQLELGLEGTGTPRLYSRGSHAPGGTAVELQSAGRFHARLTLGSAAPPSPALAELATLLLHHLLESRRLQEQAALLRSALDTSASALLLFDHRAAIAYANLEADRLLSRQTEDGLEVRRSGEPHQPLFDLLCSVAEDLVRSTENVGAWEGRLALSDGTVLGCEMIRLSPEPNRAGAGPAVLARLRRSSGSPDLQVDAFAATRGLTRREAEVLRLLVNGVSVAEAATRLGISHHTVRDHVKRLYRKTGASSRNELLRLMASATAAPPVSS